MKTFDLMTAAEAVAWADDARTEQTRRFAYELHQMTAEEMAAALGITLEQANRVHAAVAGMLTPA